MLTQKRLKELFYYHPESGDFVRLISANYNARIGDQAGCLNSAGYLCIQIDGKIYRCHRLVWLYAHGSFPPDEIDHVNGIRNDNRVDNLRFSTRSENARNMAKPVTNTSGVKGVSWHKRSGKWQANIRLNGVLKYLGYFSDIEAAAQAYADASRRLHGEFGRVA